MTKTIKLCEVATVSSGNSAPQDEKLFINGIHNFVRTSDVGKIHLGIIFESKDKLNNKGVLKLKKFPKGTILFPKSGASTFLNHRVMLGMDAYVSSHLATIKGDNSKVLDGYLFYFFQSIDAANLVADSGYPSLKTQTISEIELTLPSLKEQQRVVAKLDELFAQINEIIKKEKIKINDIRKFNSNFISKQLNIISDKDFKKLSSISSLTRGPFGGSITKSMFVQNGYVVYEQKHAIKNNFDNVKYFVNEEKFNELKRFELKSGDLLMSCSGTMGKIAIVPKNIKRGIINQALLKITPNEKIVLKEYLKLIISSNYFQKLLVGLSSGAAQVNVPSVKILKNINMPVPTIEIQREILKKVSFIDSLELENLFKKKVILLNLLKELTIKNLISKNMASA